MAPAEYIEMMNPTLYSQTSTMNFYIDVAEGLINRAYFGDLADYAVALRAMHNYIIDSERPKGEAGLITAKSEGQASLRYWNKVEKGRYSDLQMTHYGQRLLAIIKARGPAISVTGDESNLLSGGTVNVV